MTLAKFLGIGLALMLLLACQPSAITPGNTPDSASNVPATPSGLAISNPTTSSLTISWSPVNGATSYQLFRSGSAAGPFIDGVFSGSATTFIDTHLSAGTAYYYEVQSTNSFGSSPLSPAASGSTTASTGGTVPTTPTGLSVGSPTSNSLLVSWNLVGDATSYQVFRASSATGPFINQVYSNTMTSFTDTSCSPSTTYYYEVQATNPAGSSALSGPVPGTTAAPLYYLYATNAASSSVTNGNSVTFLAVNTDGSVLPIKSYSTGLYPKAVAINPSGASLYVVNYQSYNLSAFAIGSDGTLTSSGTYSVGNAPTGIAICPNGAGYLYVANPFSNSISGFSIVSGGLSSVGTFAVPTSSTPNIIKIAINPSATYLYSTNDNTNSVTLFNIASGGVLSFNHVYSTGSGPTDIAITPTGDYLYTAGSSGVSALAIGSGGALSLIGTYGVGSSALTISSNGLHLYSADSDNTVSAYSITPTGALSLIASYPVGSQPDAITMNPSGTLLYVADWGDPTNSGIVAFSVDSSGSLSSIGSFASNDAGYFTPANLTGVALKAP